ncbi:MAG TPA: hypothetical protein VE954_36210 [Oligoflexus sp.]|uniref:hypothetical protein n=1 Tax=Oligoflexus sp. TaxID=1971216 RepID=UPI002D2898C8|nr:hypothetical protein [Oligoflexus sp.]HYX38579.1 hypothetical protein [Oligoflexus sp.]
MKSLLVAANLDGPCNKQTSTHAVEHPNRWLVFLPSIKRLRKTSFRKTTLSIVHELDGTMNGQISG